jgi:hypothetical protein
MFSPFHFILQNPLLSLPYLKNEVQKCESRQIIVYHSL